VSGRTLNLTNNGNTHTEIRAIRLCADVNIPSECETLSGFRLLSGKSREVSFETAGTAIVRSEFRGKLDEAQFIIR
jgi:hypothetical protein